MNAGILTQRYSPPSLPYGLLGRGDPVPMPSLTLHPEALDWQSRVIANRGTVSQQTLIAVSQFCVRIDAAGIRDRFYRLNLFCGDQLVAALVPLYLAESPWSRVRGNLTDINFNFVSGDFKNIGIGSGLDGNGSNKGLFTGILGTSLSGDNTHLGCGLADNRAAAQNRYVMGVGSGTQAHAILAISANVGPYCATLGSHAFNSTANFGDYVVASRLATGNIVAAWPSFYRNGIVSGTAATSADNFSSANRDHAVFGGNLGVGAPANHAPVRLNWYSIGLTMTQAQVTAFNNAVTNFSLELNRA